MRYYSVPADYKKETIDKLAELNSAYKDSKVIETYGQVTKGEFTSSGRQINVLPEIDLKQLEEYVKYSKNKGIKFNYTLNAACLGNKEFLESGKQEILDFLKVLKSIGVNDLTVTTPPVMELINASGLDFSVKTSAICEVNTPSKAIFYKNLKADRVVVDPDVTRDFEKLNNIVSVFGDGVEIIINNMCVRNCAYKMFHYNHEAHSNVNVNGVNDYYPSRCSIQRASKLRNLVKINWIRPEDLKQYYGIGISYFKIQGRQYVVNGDLPRMVEAYFKEDFSGNLFDLINIFTKYKSFVPAIDNKKLEGFIDAFVKNSSFCKDVCEKCGYCDKYAEIASNIEDAKKKNKEALDYYKENDKYSLFVK